MMQPTSASERDDIATRTRRKWGERGSGKLIVVKTRAFAPRLSRYQTDCCTESPPQPDLRSGDGIFLTVRSGMSLCVDGAQRTFAMIETITAIMGLVSAGIFLAHAFEGLSSRA